MNYDLKIIFHANKCTDIPCFIAFHYIMLCRYCVFLEIEGLWQTCVEQVISAIFPTVFAHFMSVCHVLIIRSIFQTFSLYYYICYDNL